MHWAAIATGFGGILLVSQPWSGGPAPAIPLLELLGAAVSWAFATVVIQRYFRPDQMASVNGHQLLAGAVVLLAFGFALDPSHLPAEAPVLWVSVAWLGIVGTAFAYSVWFHLLGRVPAPTLSAYLFLVPLVALSDSALFLGERLDLIQGAGVILVLCSIYGISRAKVNADEAVARASPESGGVE